MKKKVFYTEMAYMLGIVILALGTALMEKADFGMSMVVAPAYLVHLKVSQVLPFFSFGMAEYTFQALVLILLALVMRSFKWSYLFSFATAVIYGLVFDLFLMLTALLPQANLLPRILWFCLGELCIGLAVCFYVHTDMAPAVYELFVKELSSRYHLPFGSVKLTFDITLCVISVLMSLLLFGPGALSDPASVPAAMISGYVMEGIGVGTVVAAVVNGPLITAIDRFLCARFDFEPARGIGRFLRIRE